MIRLILAASLIAPLLMGCASNKQQTGVRIGDATLQQFEAGVTTEAWLTAILGDPSSKAVVEGVDDTVVYRYSLSESDSGLLSFVTGSSRKNVSTVYFIISEGIVTRFWADRELDRTLLGKPVQNASGEVDE